MTFGVGRLNELMTDWLDSLRSFTSETFPPGQAAMSQALRHIWCTYPALFADLALSADLYVREAEGWLGTGRVIAIWVLVVALLVFVLAYFAFIVPVLNQVCVWGPGHAMRGLTGRLARVRVLGDAEAFVVLIFWLFLTTGLFLSRLIYPLNAHRPPMLRVVHCSTALATCSYGSRTPF